MNVDDIPSIKYKNLIDVLYAEYPDAFRDDNSPKPYTSRKKLMVLLKSNKLFEQYNIGINDLYKEIKKLNSLYSTSENIIKHTPKNTLDKARKTGFYLLIDKNDRWVKTLILKLDNMKIESRTKRIRIKKMNTNN